MPNGFLITARSLTSTAFIQKLRVSRLKMFNTDTEQRRAILAAFLDVIRRNIHAHLQPRFFLLDEECDPADCRDA